MTGFFIHTNQDHYSNIDVLGSDNQLLITNTILNNQPINLINFTDR